MSTTATDFFATDFVKALRMPALDVQAIYAAQRKNVEAVSEASKMALEGAQQIVRKQAEIVNRSFENASDIGNKAKLYSDFEDAAVGGAQAFKGLYQDALSNVWDISDLTSKSSTRSLGIINKRVAEAFDEVKSYFKAPQVKAPSA